MNRLRVFSNEQFGQIRTLDENGSILFCGYDIAKALGYVAPRNAVAAHCKGALKRCAPTASGEQEMSFIPEGDVYRLITRSNLPAAEQFERWVFDEVMPSIRKHGAYMTPETIEKVILNPDFIIGLAQRLKDEQEKCLALESKIEQDKPAVFFAANVAASDDTILVRDLAKLIKQSGKDIGEKRLYEWLRGNGYLIKSGSDRNMPTQKSMEMSFFVVRESTINTGTKVRLTRCTRVTGRGQMYFINKLAACKAVL